MAEATGEFACGGCGKRYRWKPELANRRVKCPCGAVMTAPGEAAGEEDLYEVASEAEAPRKAEASTPRAVSAVAAAVAAELPSPLKADRVLEYRGPAGPNASEDSYFPDKTKDLHIPLVLLAGGVIVEFLAGWWGGPMRARTPLAALSGVGVELVVGTGLMLVAVLLAARFRQIDLGRFWTAVLKLSAVSVAPGAVMTVVGLFLGFIVFGGLIAWVIGFCFYFALLGVFFDLDQSDTWYCVIVIFLVKLGVLGLVVLGAALML